MVATVPWQATAAALPAWGGTGESTDGDGDGTPDPVDNCPDDANPDQADFDADGDGDSCDNDDDGDGDPDATDCEPFDPSVHEGAIESCNGIDDDCDATVDPEGADGCTTFYLDGDGDLFGVTADSRCLCEMVGFHSATVGGDCDDADGDVNPGATESCNGIDDDCNGASDEAWPTVGNACDGSDADQCLDGAIQCTSDGSSTECNDTPTTVNGTEVCNGADDDCNGAVDDPWSSQLGTPCDAPGGDQCAEGTWVCNSNGSNVTCFGDTNHVEICDGQDNDCDGITDEGCDDDNDGYCDVNMTVMGSPATCQNGNGDCNDNSFSVHPGATEVCNGIDDDCDTLLDAADGDTAWPAADSYEPNQLFFTAPEIFEASDPLLAFGPSSATRFHVPGDLDYYFWDDFSNQLPPVFMMCRVTGMSANMSVDVFLGYRRSGDPALPYLFGGGTTCSNLSNGQHCFKAIASPTIGPDPYGFVVGVLPSSGIDPCNTDYVLECKMSYVTTW